MNIDQTQDVAYFIHMSIVHIERGESPYMLLSSSAIKLSFYGAMHLMQSTILLYFYAVSPSICGVEYPAHIGWVGLLRT